MVQSHDGAKSRDTRCFNMLPLRQSDSCTSLFLLSEHAVQFIDLSTVSRTVSMCQFFSAPPIFVEPQYPPRSWSNGFLCLHVYMTRNCFAWSVDGMHGMYSSDGSSPDNCSDYLPTFMEPIRSPP